MPEWGDLQVDQLRFMARRDGDAVAYRDLDAGTSITFTEWDVQSNRLARALVDAGIRPGERVSIYLPGDEALRWIVAYAAVHKAGAVVVPDEHAPVGPGADHDPRSRRGVGRASRAERSSTPRSRWATRCRRSGSSSRRAATRGDRTSATGATVYDYEEFLATDGGDLQVPRSLDDLADIMYTSGTTGLPKGVAVRHRNVAMIPNHEPVWTGAGWIHGAPMFTFAGIAFIYNPMKMGLVGLYLPKFDAGRWLGLVADGATADGVPRAGHGRAARRPSRLRDGRPDQRPLGVDRQRTPRAADAAHAPGATPRRDRVELLRHDRGGPGVHRDAQGRGDEADRVGRQAGGADAAEGGPGGRRASASRARSASCSPAWRAPSASTTRTPTPTASTWTADGWLRSGDLAYLDEDGFLYIAGRKKDMIIRGGHNVYPTDVEAVLLEHPDVQEAAVVGIPHPVLGEDIAAWVVLRDGTSLDADELRRSAPSASPTTSGPGSCTSPTRSPATPPAR